nr:MAG TPA: hypothetical protein [Bacteriophage sp.]
MSNHWKDSQFWTKVQKSTSDVFRRLKEVGGMRRHAVLWREINKRTKNSMNFEQF